ncbi:glutamine-hydrolyzing carbamoyl-phosphate synthase small subunit [Rhodospirillaceae bacterium KN72]|uniref:Carbamoyl phosphate synthase small chain n=1 Tax=Pacificispira spongiicola TaxID=2729598 RepID=A0A7Y0HD93_9PROT|nr:glutamine-hydrolyzing carbamoyl-phosphate synthase small subunit [Pacificispira spongiicola]NMM43566.1 glutamine-hydrolyzing carbamoyl-phosphate synthase small subunit [Pacificispira spongiicola]
MPTAQTQNGAALKDTLPEFPVQPEGATAALVLADGTVIWGRGAGAEITRVGEVCFNTSITGYQEILTDPSYAGQMIAFTFPHIGNVGANLEDIETTNPAACGAILRADITEPSNFRAVSHLDGWLKAHDLPALTGVDTRKLTRRIRDLGAPNAVLSHNASGTFDLPSLWQQARDWPGLEGMDLAKQVSCTQAYDWDETAWTLAGGYGHLTDAKFHVVAVDFGIKRNILRCLATLGCKVTVLPATATAEEVLSHKPDGVFLSNGPGDPAATGEYAVPMIQGVLESGIPTFGICLGHQMLALAVGAKTKKMHLGHRGANHPIKDLTTGKVEITSQNHGFVVDKDSLPGGVEATHFSLFDGTLAGIRLTGKPVFSVQYHPEASPGPQDSHYLFKRFVDLIVDSKA